MRIYICVAVNYIFIVEYVDMELSFIDCRDAHKFHNSILCSTIRDTCRKLNVFSWWYLRITLISWYMPGNSKVYYEYMHHVNNMWHRMKAIYYNTSAKNAHVWF